MVSDLERLEKPKGWWRVHFGDGKPVDLAGAALKSSGIFVGASLSRESVEELGSRSQGSACLAAAYSYLAMRPRSTAEVRERLGKRFDPQVVERTIVRLVERKFLNDEEFASTWADQRARVKGRSSRAISAELRMKGLDRETIDRALETADDESVALRVGQRRMRRLDGVDGKQRRYRLMRHLAGRGFSYEIVKRVVSRLLEENEVDRVD